MAVPDVHQGETIVIRWELVEAIQAEAAASHISVDELIHEQVQDFLRRRAGLRGVAEWEAENGKITEHERAAARKWLRHALHGDA